MVKEWIMKPIKDIKKGVMQELLTGRRRLSGFEGEWKTTDIGTEFDLYAGGDLIKEYFSPMKTNIHRYPIYANALQNNGLYGYTALPRFKGDSITITGRGDIGVAMYRDIDFDAIVRLLVLTPKSNSEADSQFTTYLLNTCIVFPQESTGVPQLTVPQIRNVELFLPPKPEQRRIAAVLSDTDAYIDALEKHIAKKRNIKKGAMQELLTGKRRLPGFEGEWVEKCGIFEFHKGTQCKALEIGKYPHYNGGQTNSSYTDDYNAHNKIIISEGGNSCGYVNYISGNFWAGGHCYVVDDTGFDKLYLFNLLKLYEPQIMSLRVGSGLPNVQSKGLKELPFWYTTDEREQAAIAAILSDMDAEIDVLTAKLNKVRNIKRGIMQELLTGRIRLLEDEEEAAPEAKPIAKVIEMPKREPQPTAAQTIGHSQQFDDAVMIAGIVNVLYSDKFPLGRKKVQKCLYFLRRHQDESTAAFKKKAAGPYADEVRYKGGEPIARSEKYITTTTAKDKGTIFARGSDISQALDYIARWGKQADIQWVAGKLKYKKVDELELLATVDMAICDLEEAGIPVSVATIKHLIATNEEWKAKLKKRTFSDANIAKAIKELQTLL